MIISWQYQGKLFSNNKEISKDIFNAGEITGEEFEMPLDDDMIN